MRATIGRRVTRRDRYGQSAQHRAYPKFLLCTDLAGGLLNRRRNEECFALQRNEPPRWIESQSQSEIVELQAGIEKWLEVYWIGAP